MRRPGRRLSLVLGGALVALTLTPAHASNNPAAPPQSGFAPALEFIGIHDIQLQLAARGYDPGPATGAMSEATYRAIIAYQHDYGLAQDGIAGPVVQNALHFMPRRPAPPALAVLTPPGAPRAVPAPLAPPVAAVRMRAPPPAPPPPPAPAAIASPEAPPPAGAAAPAIAPEPSPGSAVTPRDAAEPAATDGPAPAEAAAPAPAPEASPAPAAPAQDAAAPAAANRPAAAAKEAALGSAPPRSRPALGPLDPRPKASPRTPVGVGPLSNGAAPPAAKPAAAEAEAPVAAAAAQATQAAAPSAAAEAASAVAIPAAAAPPVAAEDAELAKGDEAVREAQRYLKELGYYKGDEDGVMGWPTVEALVKFDASGAGPNEVIADAHHPDAVWLARLRTAAAAKEAGEKAP